MTSISIETVSDIIPAPFSYITNGLYACASGGTSINNNRYLKLSISDAPESYCLQFAVSAAQRDSTNKNYLIYLRDVNTSSWLNIGGKQHTGKSYDVLLSYRLNGGSAQNDIASFSIDEEDNYHFSENITIRLFISPNKIETKYKSGSSWKTLNSYQWDSFNLSFDLSNIILGSNLSVIYNLNQLKLYNYDATEELATCPIPNESEFLPNCPSEPGIVKSWAFTQIGNPTISENGEVTNFQKKYTTGAEEGSYLSLDKTLFKSSKKSFILYGCFMAKSVTGRQTLLHDGLSNLSTGSANINITLNDNVLKASFEGNRRTPQILNFKNIQANKKYFFSVVMKPYAIMLYIGESYNNLNLVDSDCSLPAHNVISDYFTENSTMIGYSGSNSSTTGNVFDGTIQVGVLEIQEDDTVLRVATEYEDPVDTSGTIKVSKGYYNTDGTNIIRFINPITKTLTEAAANLSYKNNIVLTLDSEGTSSFVLNGSDKTLTGYKKVYKLDSPSVYVDPSKQYILGTTASSESWKEIKAAVEVSPEYTGGDNYTILGSDAKVTDGIASGFTNTSGLTIPNNPFVNADINSIKMFFEVTTGSETTPYQEVLAQNNCILVRRGNVNNWSLAVYTGSSWLDYAFGNFELNTKYYIRILYFKSATTFEGFTYNGGYTYMEVSKDNATWTRQSANQKPLFNSGKPMYIGYNGSAEAWSGSIDLNNTKFYLNDTLVWSLSPSEGSVKINKGYKYIDEINGSFLIEADTTKTLDELVVGDKAEQMGLYLVNKTDLTTDFVLSATEPTTDITYAEKIQDVYLDRTLSYIYGDTADTRVKFTINATPNTATVNMVDLAPSTPVQVSGIGTATILVDPSNNTINYGVSAEGYTTKSDTVTATGDVTLSVVLEEEQREEPVATYPTSNFYGWRSSNGINSNNIFTLTETPTPNTIAYMSNACTDGRGNFAQDESSISAKHLSIDSDRIFLDDTTYWTRDSSLDGEFVSMILFSDDTTYDTYAVPYPHKDSSMLVNGGDTLFLVDTMTQNMTAVATVSGVNTNTCTITYNGHTLTPMTKVWQATSKIGG